jgi:hypothetical protein
MLHRTREDRRDLVFRAWPQAEAVRLQHLSIKSARLVERPTQRLIAASFLPIAPYLGIEVSCSV